MVEMLVGVNDNLDILGVKAQLPDGLEHQVGGAGIAAVKDQQTVAGVHQVGADLLVPDIVEIPGDTEGLLIIFGGVGVKVQVLSLLDGLQLLVALAVAVQIHPVTS